MGDTPPSSEDKAATEPELDSNGMKLFTINRQNGYINSVFMDWSVRKVAIKELWKLKWHKNFNTNGLWTKAGGVQTKNWPEWMRDLKEY